MLPAGVAKLGELEPPRGGLLVLGRRIVPVLAIRALQGNDLAHDYFLSRMASHLGWQAAWPAIGSLSAPPTGHAATQGLWAPAALFLNC
jgi:hypothetical protein